MYEFGFVCLALLFESGYQSMWDVRFVWGHLEGISRHSPDCLASVAILLTCSELRLLRPQLRLWKLLRLRLR